MDSKQFHPGAIKMNIPGLEGRFVFVPNFEWVPRIGHDLLIKLFWGVSDFKI